MLYIDYEALRDEAEKIHAKENRREKMIDRFWVLMAAAMMVFTVWNCVDVLRDIPERDYANATEWAERARLGQ